MTSFPILDMSFLYSDLAVRGRDGRRVAITDCKLEPLNLLIPGNAPIVVPKKHAWRSPSQQAKGRNKMKVEATQNGNQVDSEEESLDDDDDDNTQFLIEKPQRKHRSKTKFRKDSIAREKPNDVKHRGKGELNQEKAELECEEATDERKRLQRRVAKQEAYITKLRARYKNGTKTKSNSNKNTNSKKDAFSQKVAKDADTDDSVATDDSLAVREMLANMKIRAGGRENPRFFAQPGDLPWSVSDDSQLIALKNGSGDSYAVIGECMGRRAGEVKRRFKYLKDCDFKIPGVNETTEADTAEAQATEFEKTGEETTDAEHIGGETTEAEETDNENKDGGGETTHAENPHDREKGSDDVWTQETDTQLWRLKNKGKTWAEIHAIMGGSKSSLKDRYKHLKSIGFKALDEATDADRKAEDDEKKNVAVDTAGGDDFMAMTRAYMKKQMEAADPPPEANPFPASSKHAKYNKAPSSLGVESVYNGSASDVGTSAYIAQYARNLLAEATAGRARIPEPDEIFDEDDCILLALADSRRRENRWLEIQADYFNVTNRMVPQELLKWKLGGGRKPGSPGDEDY